jgi:predicted GIY-YIG superfamily endonuclease
MYILYRTTNTINGKYYIGVSNGNNKWYKGSGTALKNAIKKHGTKNFITEIIEMFETEQEAFNRERQIVTEYEVNDRNCYNMKSGGKGGTGQKKTEAHKKKISDTIKSLQKNRTHTAGRNPAVPFEETYRVWKEIGSRKGAEYFGISLSAFRSRVATAKKKLTT